MRAPMMTMKPAMAVDPNKPPGFDDQEIDEETLKAIRSFLFNRKI